MRKNMNAAFQTRIQRYGWDKAEPYYDKYWNDQLKLAQERMIELSELKPGKSVLELACGSGLVTFPALSLIGEYGKLIGTDISDKMINNIRIASAEKGFSNCSFIRMDGDSLEFTENTFDAVICALGFMYFNDPFKVLKDIYKTLKPGGRVISLVWGEREKCGWSGIFPVVDSRVQSDVCPLFFQLGTKDNFSFLHKEAGYIGVESERINYFLHYKDEESAIGAAFEGGPVALAYSKFDRQTKYEAQLEYLNYIKKFKNGNGYNLPGEFVIVKGFKSGI
jgi:ubiquinone/menaquinone biosynthesis C-methylase UbiE